MTLDQLTILSLRTTNQKIYTKDLCCYLSFETIVFHKAYNPNTPQ